MRVRKDPSGVREFYLPWAVELDGETISTSQWQGGLTIASSRVSGSKTYVTVSGGSEGEYEMTNTITTSGGQTLEKSLEVKVVDL